MSTWIVTLADGTRLGTVRAATYEEAIELAMQLVARAGREPGRFSLLRDPTN